MDLARALHDAKIEFAIDQLVIEKPSDYEPGKINKMLRTRIRFADFGSVAKGETPPTLEHFLPPDSNVTLQKLLALGLKKLLPEHPIRRRYLDSVGNTPVTIDPKHLDQGMVSELIHTQLRKCIDSKEGIIQWNAIHHLMPEDWGQITGLIKGAVEEEIERCETKGVPLLRRNVGMKIKEAMTEGIRKVEHREHVRASEGVEMVKGYKERSGVQEFALRAFRAANQLTPDEDWAFGWTAFLCEEPKPAAAVEAEADASAELGEKKEKPAKKAAAKAKP